VPDEPQRDEPGGTSEAAGLPESAARRRAAEQRRRRRDLDEVFGDVLPDTTSDEQRVRDRRDDEILRDVPPHHS
jgi:hypothetical protein